MPRPRARPARPLRGRRREPRLLGDARQRLARAVRPRLPAGDGVVDVPRADEDRGHPEGEPGVRERALVVAVAALAVFCVTAAVALAKNINGTPKNDRLVGTAQKDKINGRAGNDTMFGNGGNDTILGSDGRDTAVGGNGDDDLEGGTGNDSLNGGRGADLLK